MFAGAVLHVENVIAWRQLDAITSSFIGYEPCNFTFRTAIQHNERIVGVTLRSSRALCRFCLGEIDLAPRQDVQLSFEPARRRSFNHGGVANEDGTDASASQAFHSKKMGGIEVYLSR